MKKLSALALSSVPYLTVAAPAFAKANPLEVVNTCPPGQFNTLCTLNFGGPLLGSIVTLAFIIAALIALGFLIYGGIRWITSGGDKAGVETARNTIVASLVGLVIVFLAYFLVRLIFNFFGLNFGNLELPNIKG